MHYVVPAADHAKYVRDTVVQRSSMIPNAGDGLYADKDFKFGDLICELPGCWIPSSALDDKEGTGTMQHRYPFTVEGNKVLSYLTHPCQGNKINSCTSRKDGTFSGTLNVELRQKPLVPPESFNAGAILKTEALLGVYANGDITKGQELLADYGGTFFKNVSY